jgi:glycosyltransferase involved in cell wall biosynthesis
VIDRPTSIPELVRRRRSPFVNGSIEARRRIGGTIAQVTSVDAHVSVLDILSPAIIEPLVRRRGWWFDAFRDARVLDSIMWAVERMPSGRRVAIAWTPTVAPALERLGVDIVFDSLDNWLLHPTLRAHAVDAVDGYRRILPGAAAVYASGPASAKVLERWSPHVDVLQNGVDPGQFASPGPRPADLPIGPVVLYAGKLADRIDTELINAVSGRLSAVQFVFLGPLLRREVGRQLRRHPNVHVLGDRPYALIPSYLAHSDVIWIPHRVGEGETGGDPIKMYEAWAAGRQVVTTPIDGIDQWQDRLFIVGSAEATIETIAGLLEGTVPPKPVSVPHERSWDAIAADLLRTLMTPFGHEGRTDPGP